MTLLTVEAETVVRRGGGDTRSEGGGQESSPLAQGGKQAVAGGTWIAVEQNSTGHAESCQQARRQATAQFLVDDREVLETARVTCLFGQSEPQPSQGLGIAHGLREVMDWRLWEARDEGVEAFGEQPAGCLTQRELLGCQSQVHGAGRPSRYLHKDSTVRLLPSVSTTWTTRGVLVDDQPTLLPTRRSVLAAAALVPLASLLPALLTESRARAAAGVAYRFLAPYQVAVVTEATARLVPGPTDDPAEIGHPGAREADVVRYIDTLLSAFDDDPPSIFAGGPWSNRHAPGPDQLATFVPLEERQLLAWRARVADLRKTVAAAVVALDAAAKGDGFGDFLAAPTAEQDHILASLADVRDLLFGLTIDGMYSIPEYGGNAGLSAWKEIGWPGDVQPVGYSAAEVAADDGPDPVALADLSIVREVLADLPVVATAMRKQRSSRG